MNENLNEFIDQYFLSDDDECTFSNLCAQKCVNSVGSFECSCYSGYKLEADKLDCVG